MNWKHLLVIALAALLAVSACKKKKAEENKPAEQPPATEPATEQPPAEQPPAEQPPAEGGDACAALMEKYVACTKEMSAGMEMPAEAVEATKQAGQALCDGLKMIAADAPAKALDLCKDKKCDATAEWMTCISGAAASLAGAAAGVAVPPTP